MSADQPQSIADRIAALKINQVGRGPPLSKDYAIPGASGARSRPPPPPPPPSRPELPARPPLNGRTCSTNNPPTQDHGRASDPGTGNLPLSSLPHATAYGMDGISRPALPPRTSNASFRSPAPLPPPRPSHSPALPPRRPSETPSFANRRTSDVALSRRDSNESISSIGTARSGASARSTGTALTSQSDRYSIRAPSFDPTSLPTLPAKRTQQEKEVAYQKYSKQPSAAARSLARNKSTPSVLQQQDGTTPPPSARPAVGSVVLDANRSTSTVHGPESAIVQAAASESVHVRAHAPPPKPRKSALSYAMNDSPRPTDQCSGELPIQSPTTQPPLPEASTPDLTALLASKPKVGGKGPATIPQQSCLLCRDYSGPDSHAASFPRESLPSQDVGWLAVQLTSPFRSSTDKARALFTWLHHNVAYDTAAFFGGNVQPSTPQSTLRSGLAVCEGYAGLFAALAIKAGLEAYVVSGHGKGFGYSKLAPGDPIPTFSTGHAWNVVKIDGGQWKLIDCCWGAGAVNGSNQPYQKRFSPERFTQSNDDFGRDHFPSDSSQQFRDDRCIISWEEYITGARSGCAADFTAGFVTEEGLHAPSFQPMHNPIGVVYHQQLGPTLRFSFQKCCPHWDPVRCGKGPYYMYVLHLDALDGSKRQDRPFDTNGAVWWCDVPVADLGQPGQKARIYALTVFNGKDARGFTREQWEGRVGSWAYGGVCTWDVA